MERKPNRNSLGPGVQNKQSQQMRIKDQLVDLQQTVAHIISQFLVLELKDPQIIEQHLQKIVKQYLLYETSNQKLDFCKRFRGNEEKYEYENLENQIHQIKQKYPKLQDEAVYIETENKIASTMKQFQNFVQKGSNQNQLLFNVQSLKEVYAPTIKKVEQTIPFLKFIPDENHHKIKFSNQQYFKVNLELSPFKTQQRLNFLLNKIKKVANIVSGSSYYITTLTNYQTKMQKIFYFLKKRKQISAEQYIKQWKEIANQQGKQYQKANKEHIDIVLIMSTNKTMGTFVQKAKAEFKKIQQKFQQSYPNSSLNFAFVSYTDHQKKNPRDLVGVKTLDFNTAESIQKYIQNINTGLGGGDWTEAVHDGLYAVKKLGWRQNSIKFAFLLFDAPPHGKQYSNFDDNFSKGCPCGITLTEIADYYNSNSINIYLKVCGPKIGKTVEVFENVFRKELFSSSQLNANNFSNAIAQNIVKKIKDLHQTIDNREKQYVNLSRDVLNSILKKFELQKILISKLEEVRMRSLIKLRQQQLQKLKDQIKYSQINVRLKIEEQIKKIVDSLMPLDNRIFTQNITRDIIKLFEQHQSDPKILKNVIDNFNLKFLTFQAKINESNKIGEEKKKINLNINSLRKQIQEKIAIGKKTGQAKNPQKLEQRIKQYENLKERMKIKSKVTFQQDYFQNSIHFSGQGLDLNSIKAALNDAVKNQSFLKIKVNEAKKNLRGGAEKTFTFQVELQDLKTQLITLNDRIARIATVLKNVQSNKYVWAIAEQYLNDFTKIFKGFEYKRQEIEDLINFGSEIDLVIVMDTTGSMGEHLEKAKKDSSEIIRKFKERYKNSSVNYAFVSYKDHCDDKTVEWFDFDTGEKIQQKIQAVEATGGGGNGGQAVHDGLFAVKKLSWRRSSKKFLYLIFDDSPHGRQYSQRQQAYPDGCPCGITLNQISSYYNDNKIFIKLLICGNVFNTQQIFKQKFDKELFDSTQMKNNITQSILEDLKQKMKLLQSLINEKQKQFAQITNKILYEIQKDVQKIIRENQQLKTLQNYEQKFDQFNKSFDTAEQNSLSKKSEDIKPLSKDDKIPQIQKKWAQILSLGSEVERIKAKKKLIKDSAQSNKKSDLVFLLRQEIENDHNEGDSKQRIVKRLEKNHKISQALAKQVVNLILK